MEQLDVNKMSQTQMVQKHLEDFGSITTWEAFQDYGITRLSAKIYDLRHKGLSISTEMQSAKNRYGKTVSYGLYKLNGGTQ